MIYNGALQGLNVLFPLVTAPYISRVLGVENVGVVSFITTYAGYFVLFAMFGISYYGVREIAKVSQDKEKTNQLFSELFKINSIATLIVSIIYIVTIFFIPEFKAYLWLYIVGGVSIYLVPISIDWFFQGQENFRLITIRSAAIKTLSFAGLFIFVRERDDLLAYVLLSSFAIVGNQVWNIIYATKKGVEIKVRSLELRKHFKPMFIFFCFALSGSFFNMLDVVMLGFWSTYEQVGLFTSPNKIIIIIITLITSINIVILPRLSANNINREFSISNVLLQKTFDIISFLIVPASIGLALCSFYLVPLFFGEEFIGSIIPMQILSLKVIIDLPNIFFVNNILLLCGCEKKFLIVVCATGILSFILNCIFIPRFGAIGASITLIMALFFQFCFNLYFVYKCTPIRIKWGSMTKALICSTPILLIYFLLDRYLEINQLLFLLYFIFASVSAYVLLQIFLIRNYIVVDILNLIKRKVL